jgi:hypothetical protein
MMRYILAGMCACSPITLVIVLVCCCADDFDETEEPQLSPEQIQQLELQNRQERKAKLEKRRLEYVAQKEAEYAEKKKQKELSA